VVPMSIIRSRPIRALLTEDQDGKDSKIIAVPVTRIDPSFSTIGDIKDISYSGRHQLEHFIKHHKDLEKDKYVKILGWKDIETANKSIFEAKERYRSDLLNWLTTRWCVKTLLLFFPLCFLSSHV
jgi:inorganic pyrophosphatase